MLMNAPKVGGASREVLFRLGIVADPAAPASFKRFGDQILVEHKRLLDDSKKTAAAISTAWKSSFEDAAKQVDSTVKRTTASAEQSINRLTQAWLTARQRMGDDARMPAAHPRMDAMGSIAGRLSGGVAERVGGAVTTRATRMGGGIGGEDFSRIGQGAVNIGSAIAMSGLIGEEDSQKMLDALIKISVATQGIKGGIDIISSGVKMLGGTGGLSALLAGPAIPLIAAAAGAAVLIVAANENANDPGNSRPSPGGVAGTLPSAGERPSFWMNLQRNPFSDFTSRFTDPDSRTTSDVLDSTNRSFRRVGSQQKAADFERGANQFNRESESRADGLRLQIIAKEKTALEERLQIARDLRKEALATAEIRLGASEKELSNAQRLLDVRQQEARDAKDKFGSDLERFADLDPLERSRLARIKGKVDRGGTLTADESRLAGGFNEFRDAASRSNQARGLAAGGGAIFTSGARNMADAARMATEAQAAVSRAELTVKREQELVIRLERVPDNERQWQTEITRAAKQAMEISKKNEMSIDDLRKELRESIAYRRTLK